MFEVKDLNVFYGDSHVIRNIGFRVGTRETVAIMGRNGMGKTTLLKSLIGVLPARSGEATLEGKPLTGNWEAGGIRSGVLLIPFFGLVEIFILLTRESGVDRGRRLGDEWAKTRVIFEPQPETTGETPAA